MKPWGAKAAPAKPGKGDKPPKRDKPPKSPKGDRPPKAAPATETPQQRKLCQTYRKTGKCNIPNCPDDHNKERRKVAMAASKKAMEENAKRGVTPNGDRQPKQRQPASPGPRDRGPRDRNQSKTTGGNPNSNQICWAYTYGNCQAAKNSKSGKCNFRHVAWKDLSADMKKQRADWVAKTIKEKGKLPFKVKLPDGKMTATPSPTMGAKGDKDKGKNSPRTPKSPSNKKDEACRNWLKDGKCSFGDKCRFSHAKDVINKAKRKGKRAAAAVGSNGEDDEPETACDTEDLGDPDYEDCAYESEQSEGSG